MTVNSASNGGNIVAPQAFAPVVAKQEDRQSTAVASVGAITANNQGALDALATAASSLSSAAAAAAAAAAASGKANEMTNLVPPSVHAIVQKLGKFVLVIQLSFRGCS